MTQIFISVGSNIERDYHAREAICLLRDWLDDFVCSPIYHCAPVGFVGEPFYNFVVGGNTSLTLPQVVEHLRVLEHRYGRAFNAQKYKPRTLDLDLLLYGELCREGENAVPRDDIVRFSFVLKPLADLIPTLCHPQLGVSYQQLWQQMAAEQGCNLVAVEPPWLAALGVK